MLRCGRLRGLEGRGGTGYGRGDGSAVAGEGLVLRTAGICNFGAAPRGGACCPGLHDEGNALSHAVDVGGAAQLIAVVEAAIHLAPIIFELEEESSPAGGLHRLWRARASARPRTHPRARPRTRLIY
jgi:hypothetical protein